MLARRRRRRLSLFILLHGIFTVTSANITTIRTPSPDVRETTTTPFSTTALPANSTTISDATTAPPAAVNRSSHVDGAEDLSTTTIVLPTLVTTTTTTTTTTTPASTTTGTAAPFPVPKSLVVNSTDGEGDVNTLDELNEDEASSGDISVTTSFLLPSTTADHRDLESSTVRSTIRSSALPSTTTNPPAATTTRASSFATSPTISTQQPAAIVTAESTSTIVSTTTATATTALLTAASASQKPDVEEGEDIEVGEDGINSTASFTTTTAATVAPITSTTSVPLAPVSESAALSDSTSAAPSGAAADNSSSSASISDFDLDQTTGGQSAQTGILGNAASDLLAYRRQLASQLAAVDEAIRLAHLRKVAPLAASIPHPDSPFVLNRLHDIRRAMPQLVPMDAPSDDEESEQEIGSSTTSSPSLLSMTTAEATSEESITERGGVDDRLDMAVTVPTVASTTKCLVEKPVRNGGVLATSASKSQASTTARPPSPSTGPPLTTATPPSPPTATSTTRRTTSPASTSTSPPPTTPLFKPVAAAAAAAATITLDGQQQPRLPLVAAHFLLTQNHTSDECRQLSQRQLVEELKRKGTYNPDLMAWDALGVMRFIERNIQDQYEKPWRNRTTSEEATERNVEALARILKELNLDCDVRNPQTKERLYNLTTSEPRRTLQSPSLRVFGSQDDDVLLRRAKRHSVLDELYGGLQTRAGASGGGKERLIIGESHLIPFGCDRRGTVENGYLRLCSACQSIRRMPTDFFPPFINEVMCDTDNACLYFYDFPHGKCRQRHMNFVVLRNVGTQQCQVWQKFNLNVRVSCECFVDEMSFFSKYV